MLEKRFQFFAEILTAINLNFDLEVDVRSRTGADKRTSPLNNTPTPPCKYCPSACIVKDGHVKSNQRWLCNECHRTFSEDPEVLTGTRALRSVVELALMLRRQRLSLQAVQKLLFLYFGIMPSTSTISRWQRRFLTFLS
jgi:transposase-like protein